MRWRSHVGVGDPASPGPLPLDDGGVVVATAHDLALLDADGNERARTVLPEPAATPLLWAAGQVVVVTARGDVWTWTPGAAEPARVASFGSPTSGGAALAGERTLLAVTAGQTSLASIDLLRGRRASVTRAVAPGGLWLGPPTVRGEATTLALLGPASELARHRRRQRPGARAGLPGGHAPASRAGRRGPGRRRASPRRSWWTPQGRWRSRRSTDWSAWRLPHLARRSVTRPKPREAGDPQRPIARAPSNFSARRARGRVGSRASAGGGLSPVAGLAPLPPGSFVVACRLGSVAAIEGSAGASIGGKLAAFSPIMAAR